MEHEIAGKSLAVQAEKQSQAYDEGKVDMLLTIANVVLSDRLGACFASNACLSAKQATCMSWRSHMLSDRHLYWQKLFEANTTPVHVAELYSACQRSHHSIPFSTMHQSHWRHRSGLLALRRQLLCNDQGKPLRPPILRQSSHSCRRAKERTQLQLPKQTRLQCAADTGAAFLWYLRARWLSFREQWRFIPS